MSHPTPPKLPFTTFCKKITHAKHFGSLIDLSKKLRIPWICLRCHPSHNLHFFFLTPFLPLSPPSEPYKCIPCPTCDSLRIAVVVRVCPKELT